MYTKDGNSTMNWANWQTEQWWIRQILLYQITWHK